MLLWEGPASAFAHFFSSQLAAASGRAVRGGSSLSSRNPSKPEHYRLVGNGFTMDFHGSFSRTVIVAVPMLPAASIAVTVSTLGPLRRAMAGVLHVEVPMATPSPPRLFL